MDEKEIIKWGLIALGAYLIYEYIQQQGGLTNVLAGTGTGTETGTSTCPSFAGQLTFTSEATAGVTLSAAQLAQITQCGATAATPAQLSQLQQAAVSQKVSNPPPTPPATTPVTAPPASQPALLMSQQVLNAATAAGEPNNLNIDQWNFYYQQITGQQVSLPEIPTSVYTSAGVQPNADGSGPDNTSPMPVSTWLAIMQLEMPQLGLSGFRGGMGTFAKYRPHWLN